MALRRAPLTPRTARAMVLHAHIEARSHPRGSKYGSGLFATCAIAKGAQQELPRFSALLAAGSAPAIIQSPRALVRSSVCTERAPCASWREMTRCARGERRPESHVLERPIKELRHQRHGRWRAAIGADSRARPCRKLHVTPRHAQRPIEAAHRAGAGQGASRSPQPLEPQDLPALATARVGPR